MIHIADEVAPVWVIIDEGHTIYVELKEGLKPAIDVFEVLGTAYNLYNFKSLRSNLADRGLIVTR